MGVHASSPMVAIAALTLGSRRTVTDTSAPAADRGADRGAPVERRVGPQQRLAPCRRPCSVLTVLSASATSRFAPRGDPHEPLRSRCATTTGAAAGGGDGGQQRVQAADPGVAEPGALLGVPVDLDDRVVDIDQHPTARCRSPATSGAWRGQAGQEPGGDRVELADVAEGERAQERAQRRRARTPGRRPGPSRRAAAAPCRRCCRRRRPSRPPARPPSTRRWRPCRSARSGAHRPARAGPAESASASTGTSPAARHQIRIVEAPPTSPRACERVASQRCPSGLVLIGTVASPNLPARQGISSLRHAHTPKLIGGSRLSSMCRLTPASMTRPYACEGRPERDRASVERPMCGSSPSPSVEV